MKLLLLVLPLLLLPQLHKYFAATKVVVIKTRTNKIKLQITRLFLLLLLLLGLFLKLIATSLTTAIAMVIISKVTLLLGLMLLPLTIRICPNMSQKHISQIAKVVFLAIEIFRQQ